MKIHVLFCFTLIVLVCGNAGAQDSYNLRVKKYIKDYSAFAVNEQKVNGIPACITLGQGILETEAGSSELMTEANNHFGIKCNGKWTGETITHSDDKPNECFKKYADASESFKDHSLHLKTNPRYAPLFKLSQTDYASWAFCLKNCGYATNPQYAQRLIKIIEDFKLQEYTYAALDNSATAGTTASDDEMAAAPQTVKTSKPDATTKAARNAVPKPVAVAEVSDTDGSEEENPPIVAVDYKIDSSKIVTMNGMKAFYAYKDEMLLPYAVKYHIRYPRLLEMNDLADEPLPYNMYVYLEKKLTYGTRPQHTVEAGENLFMVSQSEGLQLKKLMALNFLNPNEEPLPGSVLELQQPATSKPDVKIVERTAHRDNAIINASTADPRADNEYLDIKKIKLADSSRKKKQVAPAVANKPAMNTNATQPATKSVKNEPIGKGKAVEAEDTAWEDEEDLAALKANLDKVVYGDDSKLQKNANKPLAPVKPTISSNADGEKYHVIKKGETLSAIAAKSGVSLKQLIKWNNIEPDQIKAGQKLLVVDPGNDQPVSKPVASTPKPPVDRVKIQVDQPKSSSPSERFYVIQKGETASAIARKNHITVKQLMEWNGIEPDQIKAGQRLLVADPDLETTSKKSKPVTVALKEKADKTKVAGDESKYYVIQPGETVSAIAKKNHITVKQLLQWNDIDPDKIRDGKKLRVKE